MPKLFAEVTRISGDPAVKVVPATTNLRAAVDPRAVTKAGVQSAAPFARHETKHEGFKAVLSRIASESRTSN